jgi:predicted TPR repeat methyltransferase
MTHAPTAALHDAYAADYDSQVKAYDCYITDTLFGLCYEFIEPGGKLLDAGIGSGLSSLPFAKAGLEIHGMDFSPAMLEICRTKDFAASLANHNLQEVPWPYPSTTFNLLVCCGVLHFIPDLEAIFDEAWRILQEGGPFAFTTKVPARLVKNPQRYVQQHTGEFEIFSHAPAYIETRIKKQAFQLLKKQKCFIGEDIFTVWLIRK